MKSSKETTATELLEEFEKIAELNISVVEREIYIGDIEEEHGLWFVKALAYLEGLSGDPITLVINSSGGDVLASFAIHDAMRSSECEIRTRGTGAVCSAAILLLAAGNHRAATESCIAMSHQASGFGSWGLRLDQAQARRVAVVRDQRDRTHENRPGRS